MISAQQQPDGSGDLIFNVERLTPIGSGSYRPSFLAACGSLNAAKAIASANHAGHCSIQGRPRHRDPKLADREITCRSCRGHQDAPAYTQRCTASAVSAGLVLKHSFVEAGAC